MRLPLLEVARLDDTAEADAAYAWSSGELRWSRFAIPIASAALGVACVAYANGIAIRGISQAQPLWWLGVLAIFVPTAATILLAKVSRAESLLLLAFATLAHYLVKLVFVPGRFWEFDELLHYPTIDSILRTGQLFHPNALLPVSPYYPGLETVTAAIARLTGLDIVQAAFVLVGVAHLVTVVSVFLFVERIATPPRIAAPAALFYLTCPAFLYFNSQFAYESLALPLSLACLFVLREAQLSTGARRRRLNLVGALLLLAVTVTHHVTSFILLAALLLWTAFDLYFVLRRRARDGEGLWFDAATGEPLVYAADLPGSGWVPAFSVAAIVLWLVGVASATSHYLWPQLLSGIAELIRVIRLAEVGRTLFQSNGGLQAPLLEAAIGIGSVLIILPLIPIGVRYAWRQSESRPLSRLLAAGALVYPATLALRLSRSGWEIGSRATAFVYVPLAFVIATAAVVILNPRVLRPRLRAAAIILAASMIFAGGVIAVTSSLTRQPAPYDPGRTWAPYDTESIAAADWAATTLGPGHRVVGDSAGGTLIGSLGRQELVASSESVSVSALMLRPGFEQLELTMVREARIEYVFVDRRIADSRPLKGFIYEKWERDVQPYGASVTSETVNKFSVLRDASKVFDSGNLHFFELRRLYP